MNLFKIFMDNCAFEPDKSMPDEVEASKELLRLRDEGGIMLETPWTVKDEAEHPNAPPSKNKAVQGGIYTIREPLIINEKNTLRCIEDVLTGNGQRKNYEADARHVFEAHKYTAYFVTCDERILRKASELKQRCMIEKIVRPSMMLSLVKGHLNSTTGLN